MRWSNNFQAERFALPKNGLDLRPEMEELKALAEDDSVDDVGGGVPGGSIMGLPADLVGLVLALEPIQRASLASLICGSLADELVDVRHAAGQLVDAMRARDRKASPTHRKAAAAGGRARSHARGRRTRT